MAKKNDATDVATLLEHGLEGLSALASNDIQPEALPVLQELANKVVKVGGEIASNIKGKVKALVIKKGSTFSDAGSKSYLIGGYRLEIRPNGGGYDDAKVKALLAGKAQKGGARDVLTYCDADTRYVLSWEKIEKLVEKKIVKQSELEACRNPITYAVQSPTKLEASDNE